MELWEGNAIEDNKPKKDIVLGDQLCFELYNANKKFIHFYKDSLDQFSLTYSQYIALLSLWEHAPMSVKELGEELNLDSGTLTPMLRRMEKSGWVTRTRLPEDERTVMIGLTEKALAKKPEVFDSVTGCQTVLGIDEEQKNYYLGIVREIKTFLDAYQPIN